MNKRGLLTTNPILVLIAFIVVSVFLLSILNTEDITGYAVSKVRTSSCIDSDGGRIPNVYGVVTKSSTVKKDGCSGKSVKEWYCESNSYKYKIIPCKLGCKNGACI